MIPAITPAREHAPRCNHEMTRIIGCTCGWRTPPGIEDSDVAYSIHVAIARAAEGSLP